MDRGRIIVKYNKVVLQYAQEQPEQTRFGSGYNFPKP